MKENSEFKVGDKVWFYEKETLFWAGYTNRPISGKIEAIDIHSRKVAVIYSQKPSKNHLHTIISLDLVERTRQDLYAKKRFNEDFRAGDLILAVSQVERCPWTVLETETHVGPIVKSKSNYVSIQSLSGVMSFPKNSCLLVSRSEEESQV